jgi:hypothetical protein
MIVRLVRKTYWVCTCDLAIAEKERKVEDEIGKQRPDVINAEPNELFARRDSEYK